MTQAKISELNNLANGIKSALQSLNRLIILKERIYELEVSSFDIIKSERKTERENYRK
jgi:hypothetical protein